MLQMSDQSFCKGLTIFSQMRHFLIRPVYFIFEQHQNVKLMFNFIRSVVVCCTLLDLFRVLPKRCFVPLDHSVDILVMEGGSVVSSVKIFMYSKYMRSV